MSVQAVLAPVFVQVALTFMLMFWLGYQRIGAVRRREARLSEIALGQPNWPVRTLQAANAFNNQLQLPVLFYALVVLALMMHKADLIFVLLSWLFVAARLVHAYIFITTNNVNQRFAAFTAGLIVLIIMWAKFAIEMMLYL